MDVDMDVSAPPSPILQATLPLVSQPEQPSGPGTVAVKSGPVTPKEPVVTASQPNASGLDTSSASGLTSSADIHTAGPALASASSDEAIIPGLSLDNQSKTGGAAPEDESEHLSQDKLEDAKDDESAIPGLMISPMILNSTEGPSSVLAVTHEVEKPVIPEQPSVPTLPVLGEEDECDMDMSPPPSPKAPPRLGDTCPTVPLSQESVTVPAVSEEESSVAIEQSTSVEVRPQEAGEGHPHAPGEATTTSVPASPVKTQTPLPSEPLMTGAASLSSDASEPQAPRITEPAPPVAPSDEAPQRSPSTSRGGSPMVVESLLGLSELPPVGESSVLADDSGAAQGSPTVVESSLASPTAEIAVTSEIVKSLANATQVGDQARPIHVEYENVVQVCCSLQLM